MHTQELKFKIAVLVVVAVISGYVLWYFILPLALRYEKLDMFSDYYWVVNSKDEIRQLVISFKNNGTQDLTITEVWINGFLINSTDWGGYFGAAIQSSLTNTFYVAPRDLIFESSQTYNFTVVTSSRNCYTFTLQVDENNTRNEKVKISECHFYHIPPLSGEPVIGIQVEDLGGTDVIVKEVWIDDAFYSVEPRLWLHTFYSSAGIQMNFPWREGETYTVKIKTVAGSTAEITATAD